MLSRNRRQQVGASLMVLLLVASLFQLPLAAASGQTAPPPDGETFEVTEQVNAWERSFLPLRADAENAVETVPNADWRARSPGGQEVPLNRDPIAVYETGSPVGLTFDLSNANANSNTFGGEDVEILRVHLDDSGAESVPDTFSGALDLITRENASENAGFKEVSDAETLDGDGDISFEDTPHESGHYFYVVAMKESGDGFTVSNTDSNGANGELNIDGEVTVIGMERVTVRKSAGSVSHADTVTRGETAAFEVNATSIEGDTVKQAIVLYDEEEYVTQSFVVDVTESPSTDFDPRTNTTLETSIDEVNGAASVNDSIGAMGITIGDGQVARTGGIASLIDFVGEEAGTGSPETVDRSNDHVVLDASTTIVTRSNGEATIEVETFGNWSTGDYRWVYVAVGNNSQELASQSGHVEITEESKDTDPGGDPGDGSGSDPDDGDGDSDDGDDGDDGDGDSDDGNDGDDGDGDSDDGDDGDDGDGGDGQVDDTETPTPTETATPEPDSTDANPTPTLTDSDDSTVTQTDAPDDETDTPGTAPPATTAPGFQEESPDGTTDSGSDSGTGFPLIVLGIVVVLAVIAGAAFYLWNQ